MTFKSTTLVKLMAFNSSRRLVRDICWTLSGTYWTMCREEGSQLEESPAQLDFPRHLWLLIFFRKLISPVCPSFLLCIIDIVTLIHQLFERNEKPGHRLYTQIYVFLLYLGKKTFFNSNLIIYFYFYCFWSTPVGFSGYSCICTHFSLLAGSGSK